MPKQIKRNPTKPTTAAKPGTSKPTTSTKPAVAAKPTPAVTPAPTVARVPANITRTAATVAAQRTNFGGLTDRDNAYIAFFASVSKRTGGAFTIADIVATAGGPVLAGFTSAKKHDAGVCVRLCKADVLSHDSGKLTFKPAARTLAAYANAKPGAAI